MTLVKGEGTRILNKFNAKNFNIWKFKLEMRLASVDFGGIVNKSEEASSSNVDQKMNKKYQRYTKEAMSITMLNLAEYQLVYIWSCRGSFAISTRRGTYPTFSSLGASYSHVKFMKTKTCWTTSTRSRHLRINSFTWRYPWKWKCYYDFAQEFFILLWILDHDVRDIANDEVDYEICDDMFDAWDVKEEGEETPRVWCCNGIASSQNEQSIFMQKY